MLMLSLHCIIMMNMLFEQKFYFYFIFSAYEIWLVWQLLQVWCANTDLMFKYLVSLKRKFVILVQEWKPKLHLGNPQFSDLLPTYNVFEDSFGGTIHSVVSIVPLPKKSSSIPLLCHAQSYLSLAAFSHT